MASWRRGSRYRKMHVASVNVLTAVGEPVRMIITRMSVRLRPHH